MSETFNKIVFDKELTVGSIVNMRINTFSTPFVQEDIVQNYWTLLYVLSGSLDIKTEASPAPCSLNNSNIFLLAPNKSYNLYITENLPTQVFTMAMELEGKGTGYFSQLLTPLAGDGYHILSSIIEYADDIFNINQENKQQNDQLNISTATSVKQILQARIELFLLELLENHIKDNAIETSDSSVRRNLISRTNEILHNHLYDNITITEICKQLSISKSYLSNLYNKKMGISIITHFNNIKIEEAKRLISENSYNFTEISDKLGFSSIHYFSRLFKNVTGMTPSEYRQHLMQTSNGKAQSDRGQSKGGAKK